MSLKVIRDNNRSPEKTEMSQSFFRSNLQDSIALKKQANMHFLPLKFKTSYSVASWIKYF